MVFWSVSMLAWVRSSVLLVMLTLIESMHTLSERTKNETQNCSEWPDRGRNFMFLHGLLIVYRQSFQYLFHSCVFIILFAHLTLLCVHFLQSCLLCLCIVMCCTMFFGKQHFFPMYTIYNEELLYKPPDVMWLCLPMLWASSKTTTDFFASSFETRSAIFGSRR